MIEERSTAVNVPGSRHALRIAPCALNGVGDLDGDGKADLTARDTTDILYFYNGTGNAAAPCAARVQIGCRVECVQLHDRGWGLERRR
ncbi:FG-GAP repeat domain-containing protein [Streptomyces sp. NPDC020917]|uniref:FG-GAP repeat domain-containing protein n=1 Tax=Streptomyces sp. NPDC020917 TaxID=3365102 RepID=UPI0037BDB399